ncbi:MAG: hypothetical protein JXB36_09205 [Gammaproteobacteria bacterium]|nr:hypothetical protein [Gammaproteobacteria bacterium]
MKPKPRPDAHRRELLRAMIAGLSWERPEAARLLRSHPESLTLVSWTHTFYGQHRDIALDIPGIDRILHDPEPSEEDLREIDSTARRIRRLWHLVGDALPFLGRIVARPELRLTMTEVHRYHSDEGGIATAVRGMLKEALRAAWQAGERVLLIGHSLGSVIAYDTLWELSRRDGEPGRVDLLITLGSPLATRFIRKSLRGVDRDGPERYPGNIRRWENFTARGELMALRPQLRPLFEPMIDLGLTEDIVDHTELYNHFRGDIGLNVHKSYGYLVHRLVAGCIGDWMLEGSVRAAATAAVRSEAPTD